MKGNVCGASDGVGDHDNDDSSDNHDTHDGCNSSDGEDYDGAINKHGDNGDGDSNGCGMPSLAISIRLCKQSGPIKPIH